MPTYEYRCPDGHEFELFQKMTDKPRARCPVCGKAASRQISGGAGLHFKGSGFYITDYGKDGKGPRKPEPAADSTPAKSESSDKPANPAKPEAAAKSEPPAKTEKSSAAKPSDKKAKS
ncbi:MAG TPA: FmdB family zinc ribbon protein [Gemmatimonadales bacterium]|nr:FmdB family zinc ribbon protein [Gemmatimonadales bacterium]